MWYVCVCCAMLSHTRLFATPGTAACQAPLSMGTLRARVLGWVAMPSSRGSSQPRDRTCISYVSCISRQILYYQCHLGSPLCSTGNYIQYLIIYSGNKSEKSILISISIWITMLYLKHSNSTILQFLIKRGHKIFLKIKKMLNGSRKVCNI